MPEEKLDSTYYDLLQLTPSASVQQIRRAYRELSKLYHPDTTELPEAIATDKFQRLNDAYATLSSPERRIAYDLKIGYSRMSVMQAPRDLNRPVSEPRKYRSLAYLDPSDRPLSAGEIFALFLLGVTFIACLVLVVAVSLTRGDTAFVNPLTSIGNPETALESVMSAPKSSVRPDEVPAIAPAIAKPQATTPAIADPQSKASGIRSVPAKEPLTRPAAEPTLVSPAEPAAEPTAEPTVVPFTRPTAAPPAELPAELPAEPTVAPTHLPAPSADRPADMPTNLPADRPVDRPADRPAASADRPADLPVRARAEVVLDDEPAAPSGADRADLPSPPTAAVPLQLVMES